MTSPAFERCNICGKRQATGYIDFDPGNPEVGPQPNIGEICDVCAADPQKALDDSYAEAMREEAGFMNEVGHRVYDEWQYQQYAEAMTEAEAEKEAANQ